MQRLNYDRVNSDSEIKAQIEEMVLDNSLTEREASVVWYKKIYKFFISPLGERLLKSYKEGRLVSRELPFFTELSSVEYNTELNKDVYIDEKIRLQGIIDCFFEEEDGIVLLDYKTDYVEEGNEDEIIERYRSQLKYYKDALEKITGKRVKESYLYLFGIDKGNIDVNYMPNNGEIKRLLIRVGSENIFTLFELQKADINSLWDPVPFLKKVDYISDRVKLIIF